MRLGRNPTGRAHFCLPDRVTPDPVAVLRQVLAGDHQAGIDERLVGPVARPHSLERVEGHLDLVAKILDSLDIEIAGGELLVPSLVAIETGDQNVPGLTCLLPFS